ncbi:MAG: 30S ribosomal protein S8 [Rhodobacteraceae bacterium]|nr:MAG: 30S ribosomal protein S8 [Paracoccaceae bacterium]
MNDPLGDMLTRIRNAQMRRKTSVRTPASKLRGRVLEVLRDEGYIRGFELIDNGDHKPEYEIALKYYDGRPVIRELKRVSTPGRRNYAPVAAMPSVRNGLGLAIISTSRGVMSDAQARAANVGGEVLCTVF